SRVAAGRGCRGRARASCLRTRQHIGTVGNSMSRAISGHIPRVAVRALCTLVIVGCASQHPHATPASAPVAAPPAAPSSAAKPAEAVNSLSVPIRSTTLDNGLRVVLSRDTTAPVVTVAVYYGIGFRVEPRDRTG